MSRLLEGIPTESISLSLEAASLLHAEKGVYPVYIVLTDTKTRFSKISRLITKDPYNHVSLSFTDDFEVLYTYALKNVNGMKGGLKIENREALLGSRYSLYKLDVTESIYTRIKQGVKEVEKEVSNTGYNHLALINAIFNKEIFESNEKTKMICSQFVVEILRASGVELFSKRHSSTIKPYEFVKSNLLKHVRRGTVR